MSQFILTKNRPMLGIRRKTLSQQIKVGSITIMIFLLLFFCLIALLSLRHFIESTTSGYRLRELEDRKEQLLTEYELNTMLVDKARALSAIQDSDIVKRMVKIPSSEIVFIHNDYYGVAKK